MKKSSLMGASVVAAALLAAAPIAAPVANIAVSGTQVAKADTPNTWDEAVSKIKQQSTGTTLSKGDPTKFGSLENFEINLSLYLPTIADSYTAPTKIGSSKLDKSALYVDGTNLVVLPAFSSFLPYFFSGNQQVALITDNNAKVASNMSYSLRFDYSNAINNVTYQIRDANDVKRVTNDLSTNGGNVTMSMQLYGAYGESLGDKGLVKSTVSYNVANNRAAFVKYNDTLNAKVGDSAEKYGLSNSFMNAGGSILNYDGKDITQSAYDNGAIQVGQLRNSNFHPSITGLQDGNFSETGTFYQHIAIDLAKAGVSASNWQKAAEAGLVTVNGQTPSTTNADGNVYLVTDSNNGIVDGIAYPAGTLVLKRTVNVGKADNLAKEEKVNGVVTVKNNGQGSAQLYTRSGDPIVDRALATGSNWKTDIKRTVYSNGEVYYRVSTDEFIKASDVTFSGADSNTASTSSSIKGNVVVNPLAKRSVVHVNSAAGFNTSLWSKADDNSSMNLIADRTLAGNSDWQTDQSATVNGQTFYRVSTNEWINAKYVSVK